MELKAGYKQTEVGVIPEDWSVKELGAFDPFVTSGSRGWADYYSKFGEPFIRITNLSREWLYPSLNDLRFVSLPKANSEGARTQLRDGDLLISITADIGIIGYVDARIPKPAYINQHISLARLDASAVNSQYTGYFLASANGQALFRALTDSGAKAGMNLSTVKKILGAFPPSLDEQKAIAEALSDTDALIESLEQLLIKKRQLKQGAMQELLTGERRLPGFVGRWGDFLLGDLFSFSGGLTASRNQLGTNGYCYLHYGDIHTSKNTSICAKNNFLDIPKLDVQLKKINPSTLLKDGDVVFVDASEDNEGASKHLVVSNPDDVPFISGLHTIVAKSKDDRLDAQYKRHCFQVASIKEQFRFFAVGTKVSGVSKSNIGKIRIHVPSLDEQIAIASALSAMDNEITALETQLQKARLIKQGMMQELLTGRIRLV